MEIENLFELFKLSDGVVTDSRKEVSGKIFFALKGPNFDGNLYAEKVLEKGAVYAIVSEKNTNDPRVVLVDNVLLVLQKLATWHRKALATPILGITGTNGKTTNKELISVILAKKYNTYSTIGNFNNHIGVPLSLLELKAEHEFAVIEMGANKLGDIKELCQIADPDFGFITNIGLAHLEGFVNKSNIKKEKGELFSYVRTKDGKFFVNMSEQDVVEIANDYENNILVGTSAIADYSFRSLMFIPRIAFEYEGKRLESTLYGEHNYENVKMATAIGLFFDVVLEDIAEALNDYVSVNNRSQLLIINGVSIFLDAYNANPSSMIASIVSFANFESDEKVLVLGDMLELGDQTLDYHRDVINCVNKFKWKQVVFIGGCFNAVGDKKSDHKFFESKSEANEFINRIATKGDYFLVKASRGLALEDLDLLKQ